MLSNQHKLDSMFHFSVYFLRMKEHEVGRQVEEDLEVGEGNEYV